MSKPTQTHDRPLSSQIKPTDDRSIQELNVGELRTLIRIIVEELLLEFLGDPDRGLKLQLEVQQQLIQRTGDKGIST